MPLRLRSEYPNLSDDEREKLTEKIGEIMTNVSKQVEQISDPAYLKKLEAKQGEFGCLSLDVTAQDGNLAGTLNCGEKVGHLKITGAIKYLGK